jgi:hypothetical protein
LTNLLQQKNVSIKRLKRWLFGPSSDKRRVSSNDEQTNESEKDNQSDSLSSSEEGETSKAVSIERASCEKDLKKRAGHGRLCGGSIQWGESCPHK